MHKLYPTEGPRLVIRARVARVRLGKAAFERCYSRSIAIAVPSKVVSILMDAQNYVVASLSGVLKLRRFHPTLCARCIGLAPSSPMMQRCYWGVR